MKQSGFTLLYSLIILAVIAIAALAAIQFSSLEQRMSANYRTHQAAFAAAETALREAERCVEKQTNCNNINSFTTNCNNGLCFNGTNRMSVANCVAGDATPWREAALWANTGRNRNASTLSGTNTSARYIIEFMCYVPKTNTGITPDPSNPGHWSRLYRITALALLNNLNSEVMLQSTYKL